VRNPRNKVCLHSKGATNASNPGPRVVEAKDVRKRILEEHNSPSLLFRGRSDPVDEEETESQLFSNPGIVLNCKGPLSSRAGDSGDESIDPSVL